jgi:nicotinate-nucleotide pyrophosphorylase (carboxylating)
VNCDVAAAIIEDDARRALAEDIGSGDATAALIPANRNACASVISREPAVLCGVAWFDAVYRLLDPGIHIEWRVEDGAPIVPDQMLCTLQGPARTLLSGERCALNFLQTLSGTATQTHAHTRLVTNLPVRILDTRKTLPGLRTAQKYAVRCGGGHNHRMGLFDAILIKENHIAAASGVTAALAAARAAGSGLPIEVEVETLEQLREALDAGATHLLLDNFTPDQLRAAVAITRHRARLECSGGVDLSNLRACAETGVDDISIGALTKHLRAVDLSMRFD